MSYLKKCFLMEIIRKSQSDKNKHLMVGSGHLCSLVRSGYPNHTVQHSKHFFFITSSINMNNK